MAEIVLNKLCIRYYVVGKGIIFEEIIQAFEIGFSKIFFEE